MEIPLWCIVLFGLTATLREAYNVFWLKQSRSVGTLFAFFYVTTVYILLALGDKVGFEFHGSPFVRVGVLLIFLDKAIAFIYEIISRRHKWTI